MAPKKLPPRLPLDNFTSLRNTGQDKLDQEDRTNPLIFLDPHVLLPVIEEGVLTEPSLKSWKNSVEALDSRLPSSMDHSNFQGSVYLHHQPPWLSQSQPPHENSDDLKLSDDWVRERQKIIKLDQELAKIESGKPLAQVIWAPLYQGEQVLEQYLKEINEPKIHIKISGCCHLIQSKPTMRPEQNQAIRTRLINSLKLLGKLGLNVEFFVESNLDRSAASVLDDVLETVAAVRLDQDPEHQTKFILCQMGMPEMISSRSKIPSSVSCSSILSRLFSLSLFSNFEIKLTSLPIIPDPELNEQLTERFKSKYLDRSILANATTSTSKIVIEQPNLVSEGDDQNNDHISDQTNKFNLDLSEPAWREMKKRIKFYLEPILEAFGDHRVIYSSGFPYFDLPHDELSPTNPDAVIRYQYQFEIFRECLAEFGLKNRALDNVFGLNAQRCYGI